MKKLILSILTVLPLMALLNNPSARADEWPDSFVEAVATYDCPVGPGYLYFSVIDVYQNRVSKTLWVGSTDICNEQAAKLYETRPFFRDLSMVAICVGSGEVYYLRRWSVDAWGFQVFHGDVYYGTYDACMTAAGRINAPRR